MLRLTSARGMREGHGLGRGGGECEIAEPSPSEFSRLELDEHSREWLRDLSGAARVRNEALGRLHKLLVDVARTELRRRGSGHRLPEHEIEDLAHQVADDALVVLTRKLSTFRGESRFTTWAYRFAILEVSNALGRLAYRRWRVPVTIADWERLQDRFAPDPSEQVQVQDLCRAVGLAVQGRLTPRQREVFVALVIEGVPVDSLAHRLSTTRGALYKVMFDARRNLRAALAEEGYLSDSGSRDKSTRRGLVES